MEYESLSDKELIRLINENNEPARDFLISKYKYLVVIKARPFFLSGGDLEDIMQEGMIGLFKAIRSYRIDSQASFETFASLCINRQIYTAIKNANRKKHSPLNNSYSLSIIEDTDGNLNIPFNLVESPENIFINRESYFFLEEKIGSLLTDLENKVLKFYLSGLDYEEIAKEINRNEKSVDNALSRIRKKLINIL